ncbi:MAG: translation initiation factor IF-2 [Acidimicrobiia bacterium]
MPAKKIRVYELARELGVENSVIIDLSAELKIGVKSHSSSIDDPSADRVRRLADSKGLRRDPIVEPEPKAKVEKPKKAVVSSSTRAKKIKEDVDVVEEEAPVKSKVVRSSAQTGVEASTKDLINQQLKEEAEIAKAISKVSGPAKETMQPRRGPVPPPPPGRRITPPPGAIGVRRPAGASPTRGGAGPRGTGAGQTTFPTPNTQNFPPSATPGKGRGPAGRGGPGGGRGPGGPRKKKGKKRRDESDLQPVQSAALTPKDVAVPEGEIVVTKGITVQDFAPKLNRTTADIVKMMFEAGEMLTATQSLADEMIELIADELGANVLIVEAGEEEEIELLALLGDDEELDESALMPRPPIVTVMGHVDHGKTTLLDTIRKTNVAGGESGGITQAIGAYQTTKNGKRITFIDTPGHEAFSQMRARGANATDVAVLVCAANDGVMPQTIEALNHARAAEVPIIVAVTKVDKEDADPSRVRQQLTEHELVPEEWGGSTMFIDVSPKTGQGMEDLLEAILLVSEVEELKANPTGDARGYVLESHLDPGRGPVATVLVKKGELNIGDVVVAGQGWGKIRAMFKDDGTAVETAHPSDPVLVLGLSHVPLAGDDLREAPSEKAARSVAEARERRRRLANTVSTSITSGSKLEDIFTAVARGEVATLSLVLKADTQGSLEALTDSLKKLDKDHEEVRISFVHRAVGGITESDVSLAEVSNAAIIGFNTRPDRKAREAAEAAGVDLRLYEIIYKVLEDMEAALKGMLTPTFEEVVTGEAEVREIFSVPKLGKVAGCYVQSGVITRGSKVRFLREGIVIWKGSIASLRREKDDVKEVRDGYECGVGLENYTDLKSGDIIETYEEKEVAR